MKNSIFTKCVFIAFIPLLCITVPCGCSPSVEDTIKFIADKPQYDDAVLRNKKQFAAFENRKKPDGYDVFEDFKTYYANNIKDKIDGDFYLLNPGDGLMGWVPHHLEKAFYLFADEEIENKLINPLISENIYLYDATLDNLNRQDSKTDDGITNWQVYLDVILPPVLDISSNADGFSLEFGLLKSNNFFKTYVNVYCEQVCVATCFYRANAKLSYSWFAEYFNKNLLMDI